MSCRPILRDLRCRNDLVCRSCSGRLAKSQAQPWSATYSTRVSRKSKPRPRQQLTDRLDRQPSKIELERYLQGIQNLRGGLKERDENNSFSVRFFEQDQKESTELPNEQAFGESFSKMDVAELRNMVLDLQSGLQTAEERDAFREVLSEMGEGWDTIQSADDLERMITKMDTYTAAIDDEIKDVGSDLPQDILDELTRDLPELSLEEVKPSGSRQGSTPQIAVHDWTTNQRRKITKFNFTIANVYRESRQKETRLRPRAIQSLYKAYHSTRLAMSQNWRSVPLDVWDFLWMAFSTEDVKNTNRMSRIALLSRDMIEAQVTLSPSQQVLAIEAVFVDGLESKAVESWKRCQATLGAESAESSQGFWELGARMFCRLGDLEQAEKAINKLLHRQLSPRILTTLIRTSCDKATEDGRKKAWTAYRQMRELLGKEMKLSDYDQVISSFLTANFVENALYAFVDMMSDGQIDMPNQRYLPSVVANKFFIGKWLKRLIGAGDLNGAFNVVKFMQGKGVEAASIQLNGLIGAWQRAGGAEDLQKAETLGWNMIESRVKFVQARQSGSISAWSGAKTTDWPRATIETFSLLAENYRQRNLHSKLETLWEHASLAEIKPDTFMMNQFLESLIQAGDYQQASHLYHSLVGGQKVAPDPYTFSALWKTLDINRLHTLDPKAANREIAAARAMFKETFKHKDVFKPDGMDGQLARKMLHTFRRLKDDMGFLVLLSALKDGFNFLPPETLVMELVLGTTRLTWDTPLHRTKLLRAKREMDSDLFVWANYDPEKLEEDKRGPALYEYLQKRYWPVLGTEEDKRRVIVEVAKEMGAYQLLVSKRGTSTRR